MITAETLNRMIDEILDGDRTKNERWTVNGALGLLRNRILEELSGADQDWISRREAIEALSEATATLGPHYDEWKVTGYRRRPRESYGEAVRDCQTILRNLASLPSVGVAIVSEPRECPTNHSRKVPHSDQSGDVWTHSYRRYDSPFCPDCGQSLSEPPKGESE